MSNPRIVVARGDGIGPEITDAVLRVLQANQTPLEYTEVELGERAYLNGFSTGIPPDAWDIIRSNRVLLKGPITTPQGGGYKSVNVTLRKSLGLFANVRHCRAYTPYVASLHPTMNVVILRENEEDLYAGIEYRQSQEVVLDLKVVTRPAPRVSSGMRSSIPRVWSQETDLHDQRQHHENERWVVSPRL